jgi:hypothetical protein
MPRGIIMKDSMGRRGFFGKTASAAAALPLMLQGGSRMGNASSEQPSLSPQEKPKVKRIAVEEHWSSNEVSEAIGRPKSAQYNLQGDLGEFLPYWLGRLDEWDEKSKRLRKPTFTYIKEHFFVSTSGGYQPEALVCGINAMGADRVFFATDYAAVNGKTAVEWFERTPMSDADREKIYHLNAELWLCL